MNTKKFVSRVESEHEFDDLPNTAVFEISPALAEEIVGLSNLVKRHSLCSVERSNYSVSWFSDYFDMFEDIEFDAVETSTDCTCLVVSDGQFWFSAMVKNSDVSFKTTVFDIADIAQFVPSAESEVKAIAQADSVGMLYWRAQGDADHYVVFKDRDWFAHVHMNGEMSSVQQEAWLTSVTQDGVRPQLPQPEPIPRVLVVVSGGVADYVSDAGVDVEVFDRDNFEDDEVGTSKAPLHFADLAKPIDVPSESRFEHLARASGIEMTYDDDIGRYRWESPKEGISQPGSHDELKEWQDACVKNGLIPAMNEAYAETIIGEHPELYDALEIHGVCRISDPNNGADEVFEIDDVNPDFYSVYVHVKEGGIDCVGDFQLAPDAEAYAQKLAQKYGWKVHQYV